MTAKIIGPMSKEDREVFHKFCQTDLAKQLRYPKADYDLAKKCIDQLEKDGMSSELVAWVREKQAESKKVWDRYEESRIRMDK